jgi:TetR/AcrR family transcriptional regulator
MDPEPGNRELILAEACRLFAAHGYEAVSVGEICDVSKITKPTLYYYFGSKRGLIDAVIAERGQPLLDSVHAACRYEHDIRGSLAALAAAFWDFARKDPAFARLRLSLSFVPAGSEAGEATAAFNAELFDSVEGLFREAAADHGNMKGRSRAFAATFIGTLDSYVGFSLSGLAALDEKTMHEALRQFMYGIFS